MSGAGGVATSPPSATRESFEWFQKRRAKWKQAPRPKVRSLSSLSPPKAKSTSSSTDISLTTDKPPSTQITTPQSKQSQQPGSSSLVVTQSAQTFSFGDSSGKQTSVATSTPTALPPNSAPQSTNVTAKTRSSATIKPSETDKPKPSNPFANISLVPSSVSKSEFKSDSSETRDAGKQAPAFGGLSSTTSTSSPFTSFGSKPPGPSSSVFGEASPKFSFGKFNATGASPNLFGGSSTNSNAKPSASIAATAFPATADNKPKLSIFGKPIQPFQASTNDGPTDLKATSKLFSGASKTSTALKSNPFSKVETTPKTETFTGEKPKTNAFSSAQLVTDQKKTEPVSNPVASAKPPSQEQVSEDEANTLLFGSTPAPAPNFTFGGQSTISSDATPKPSTNPFANINLVGAPKTSDTKVESCKTTEVVDSVPVSTSGSDKTGGMDKAPVFGVIPQTKPTEQVAPKANANPFANFKLVDPKLDPPTTAEAAPTFAPPTTDTKKPSFFETKTVTAAASTPYPTSAASETSANKQSNPFANLKLVVPDTKPSADKIPDLAPGSDEKRTDTTSTLTGKQASPFGDFGSGSKPPSFSFTTNPLAPAFGDKSSTSASPFNAFAAPSSSSPFSAFGSSTTSANTSFAKPLFGTNPTKPVIEASDPKVSESVPAPPQQSTQVEPTTPAGRKAAKAFDATDSNGSGKLQASSFEFLLYDIGESFYGDEFDAQLAIVDPAKSGIITRSAFVDWYTDLVEGVCDDGSLDTAEREDRAEEEANAKEKFAILGKVVDGSMSILASSLGELIESLGTDYCGEAHKSTLKKLTNASGRITETDFLEWYVNWLFASDDEDENEECSDDDDDDHKETPEAKPSLSSMFKVDANDWKCDVCSVGNKKDKKKCVACETPRQGLEEKADEDDKGEKAISAPGSIGAGGFAFGSGAGGSIGSGSFSFGSAPASASKNDMNRAATADAKIDEKTAAKSPFGSGEFIFGSSVSGSIGSGGFSFGSATASEYASGKATVTPGAAPGGFSFGASTIGGRGSAPESYITGGLSFNPKSPARTDKSQDKATKTPSSSAAYPPMSSQAPKPFSAMTTRSSSGSASCPPFALKDPAPFSSVEKSTAADETQSSYSSLSAYPPMFSQAPKPFCASAKTAGNSNSAFPPVASKAPTPFSSSSKPATKALDTQTTEAKTRISAFSSSAYPPMSSQAPKPFSAVAAKHSSDGASGGSGYPPVPSKAPTPFSPDAKTTTVEAQSVKAFSSSSYPPMSLKAPTPPSAEGTKPSAATRGALGTGSGSASKKSGESSNPFSFGAVQAPASSSTGSSQAPAPYSFGTTFPQRSITAMSLGESNRFSTMNLTPAKTPEGQPVQSIFGAAIKPVPKFDFASQQPKTSNPFGGTSLLGKMTTSQSTEGGDSSSPEKAQTAPPLFGGTMANPFGTKPSSAFGGAKANRFGTHASSESRADAAKPSCSEQKANPSGSNPFGNKSVFTTNATSPFGAASPFTLSAPADEMSLSNVILLGNTTGTHSNIDFRTRLLEFYKKHNPEKIDSVDKTLEKYEGKEEELFKKLQAKYCQSGFPLPGGSGPRCFLQISIDGIPEGRVVVKLYQDKTPLAAENFRCLCTGEKGMGRSMQPLSYKNCKVHRVISNFCVQLGDITKGNGTGGESIYPPGTEHTNMWGKFKDEPFMRHAKKGLLSMANNGPNQNSSQFFFTLKPTPYLDGKHVVFGEVVEGYEVIEKIAALEVDKETPTVPVVVSDCGEIKD